MRCDAQCFPARGFGFGEVLLLREKRHQLFSRRWMIGRTTIDLLDCGIQIEQKGPLAIVAQHALNPEK